MNDPQKSITFIMIFFFSSRRRHTRFDCDWSSDVCSSDLLGLIAPALFFNQLGGQKEVKFDWAKFAWIGSPEETSEMLSMRSEDRKSTRLNSSHSQISYAVFCLKKKKKI